MRTISKHFNDDEIFFRLPNGDLYLKPNVRRKFYDKSDADLTADTHINYDLLKITRFKEQMKKYEDVSPLEGEIDNWETE